MFIFTQADSISARVHSSGLFAFTEAICVQECLRNLALSNALRRELLASAHFKHFSSHAVWTLHQRCSPAWRFDAGSLAVYTLASHLPTDVHKLRLLFLKHCCLSNGKHLENFATRLAELVPAGFAGDISTLDDNAVLQLAAAVRLDSAYPRFRLHACEAFRRTLR